MELYHGTDFGQGFYLGSDLGVAQRWAKNRAAFSGKPIVMKYTLDDRIFSDKKARTANGRPYKTP